MNIFFEEQRVKQATATMTAWTKRRLAKHITPTGDETWNHIKKNWPTMSEANMERVFQSVP